MKTLMILVLFGGVAALGGAFFGIWQIPGLEKLPTVEQLGKSRQRAIEAEAQRRINGEPEAPVNPSWGAKPDGALGKRSGQLQQSERSLGN